MNEELRNKDNLMVSLLNQLSNRNKQPDYKHMEQTLKFFLLLWPQMIQQNDIPTKILKENPLNHVKLWKIYVKKTSIG